MNLKALETQVIGLVKEVGKYIEGESHSELRIGNKDLHDFVTHVDIESEKRLKSGLAEILPEANFCAEESDNESFGEGLEWVIDPIDGTTNFIHGVPAYAISVALTKNGSPIIGVVYNIPQKKLYHTYQGSASFCNDREISVSSQENHHLSLLATGFPYKEFSRLENYVATMTEFIKETSGLRRIGSAAIDLAMVAEGTFEGFFEYGLQPWDVAAGALLVENAGGKVTDFNGSNDFILKKSIVATNARLHNFVKDKCKVILE